MTSIDESAIVATSPDQGRTVRVPPATPREDAVTALLGTVMMLGVLSDAWAHNNIIKTLESFFTPWHALLYAGFLFLPAAGIALLLPEPPDEQQRNK